MWLLSFLSKLTDLAKVIRVARVRPNAAFDELALIIGILQELVFLVIRGKLYREAN